jgi:uncharacterized membrane protein
MTDAPKKRPWFQFHLSTAVVLMVMAGGLLGANLLRDTTREPEETLRSPPRAEAGAGKRELL